MRPEYREGVTFARADLRGPAPPGPFDVVLCRNAAFTYFAEPLQRHVLGELSAALRPAGVLVVGAGEALPQGHSELQASAPCFYTRAEPGSARPAP